MHITTRQFRVGSAGPAALGLAIALVACGGIEPSGPKVDAAQPDAAVDPAIDAATAGNDGAADAPAPADRLSPDAAPPDGPGGPSPDAAEDRAIDGGAPDAGRDTGPDVRGDSAAPDAGPALVAAIARIEASGDLCPEGSVATSVADDGLAFTMAFSEAFLDGGGPGSTVTRTCQVALKLTVSPGYQFSSARFSPRGFVGAGDPPGTVLFEDRYTFEGRRDSAFFSTDLSSRNDDFLIVRRPVDLWSPSCDGSNEVRLRIDLTATVRDGADLLALDSIDGVFSIPQGLEWRRCGEVEPIRPPPGGTDAPCDGPNKLLCAFGLACELLGEVAELGNCVDPTEVLPPQAKDENCGGYRSIPCADGLVCMFAGPRSVQEKRLGWCTPAVGGEGDNCDGFPTVPCATGLTCKPSSKRCVRDTGELGSPCGEGLRPCKAGLTCNGTSCVEPPVGEGQACGGPTMIPCRRPLTCESGVCRR